MFESLQRSRDVSPLARASESLEQEAENRANLMTGVTSSHAGGCGPVTATSLESSVVGGGDGMDPHVQRSMSATFGADFSRVRIHSDESAFTAADRLGAAAFAIGDHVAFGRDRYAPERPSGRNLLAHELAHVVQQRRSGPMLALRPKAAPVSGPSAPKVDIRFEKGANRWLVSINGIPAAEVAVASEDADVSIVVNIDPSGAEVIVKHRGDASVLPPVSADATPGIPVRLKEVDVRDSSGVRAEGRAPTVPREHETGAGGSVPLSSLELPPGNVPWLRPRGELEAVAEVGPLTDWEEQKLRPGAIRVLGVLADPEHRDTVIGYRIFATAGLTRITDREGEVQFESEVGLETPLLDPLDLIPTPGTVGKAAVGVGGKVLAKSLGKKAAAGAVTLPLATVIRLRRIAIAVGRRGARKAAEEAPTLVRKITQGGLEHSFDRHAAQWFGRNVSRATHFGPWRELIERISVSKQVFRWSTGDASTIAHLGQQEGKYFVVQFFEETGELATAFVPTQSQFARMQKAIRAVP